MSEEMRPGSGSSRGVPSAEVERVLDRAHVLGEEGDWAGMAEHLREAVEGHPDDPWLLCWLGVAERELGLEGIAYERFKRALAQHPEDPFVLATAGNAIASVDDPDAEAALRTAAMIAPHLPLARWMYGAYLSREGYGERGLAELEAARELAPGDATVAYELGAARALAEDAAGALDALARAAELDPDDGWTRVVMGLVLARDDERMDEAAAELFAGATLRPDDLEAQLLAALAMAVYGDQDRAWEMLERARQSAEGVDRVLAQQVEDRITSGPDAAARFLRRQLGASALRERLMARP